MSERLFRAHFSEGELVSDDEHKMDDMMWWCFAAGALIAYLLTNG